MMGSVSAPGLASGLASASAASNVAYSSGAASASAPASASASAMTMSNGRDFIPEKTWQGPKEGYYFGTTVERGTGYYRDHHHTVGGANTNANSSLSSSTPRSTSSTKPKRPRVQIAEDRNETRVIPSVDDLLRQAEEEASKTKIVDLNRRGVRSAAVALTKAVEKNELQRAEHADQPDEYMDSEVILYENISALKAFAVDPVVLYPAILETDLFATLMQLLLHENADIVSSVVAVFLEWLDSTLLEDEEGNFVPAVANMAAALLRDGSELLVANLARLQPSEDDDADDEVGKGTEDVLSLMENLLEMDLATAENDDEDTRLLPADQTVALKLAKETTLVSWLVQQVDEGKQSSDRCLEILAFLAPREEVHTVLPDWSRLPVYSSIFLEDQDPKAKKAKGTDEKQKKEIDGIEILLQTIAAYRKKQPTDEREEEYLENACVIMASALTYSPANVKAFLNAQGVELAMRCLKERVHAGGMALKWLEFSGSDPVYRQACEQLVQAGALKYLFPLYMGRNLPRPAPIAATNKKAKKEWQHSIEATTIRIFYCLTRRLKDDSPNDAKERLLAKFVGEEQCDRLVELCLAYDQKARMAEYKFFRSDAEEALQDEGATQLAALEAKLAGGGDIFHRLGAIIAFCCIGSKRCHERILSQLHLQQSGIGLVRDALEEFISVLGESAQKEQLQGYLEQI
jgi:beta-catenin-like protein 1